MIPAAGYPMNLCKFTKAELAKLDKIIKKGLRKRKQLRAEIKVGLKSLKDSYIKSRLGAASYI